jgi:hypothetical protein
MFYIFAIVIPIVILVILYYIRKPKLYKLSNYIDFIFSVLPFLAVYTLLLYYLETENIINSGYAFLALITFLIPIAIIISILKLYYWLRKRR